MKKETTSKVLKKKKQNPTVNVEEKEVIRKYCCHCGEMVDVNEFHKTRSHIYKDGKLHICDKCIGDIINGYVDTYGNIKDALVTMCSVTNTLVVLEVVESTLKEYSRARSKKNEIFSFYLNELDKYIIEYSTWTQTNITFECSNFGSKPFRSCLMDDGLKKISEIDNTTSIKEEDDCDVVDIELNQQQRKSLKRKWGEKEDSDLIWLSQREQSYYDTHEIPNDHINKSGVITLCNLELQEFKALTNGEDVKNILANKERVLKTTSFLPKKKSREDSASNAIDLGTLIRKREEFSPIVNKDPELDDIDNITNISKALAGALCRTARIESPLVGEFDRVMKNYTFEFSSNEEEDYDE